MVSSALAQSAPVEFQIASRSLEVGESVDATLTCTNTGPPALPEFNAPDGLTVQILNSTPSKSSMMNMIQGQTSQKVVYRYQFRVTGRKPGTYILGPISVGDDRQTYSTRPVTIVVREPKEAKTDAKTGDRYVYAELQVTPDSLYVTQSYSATLIIGMREIVIDGRRIDMDVTDVLDRGSNLAIFKRGSIDGNPRVLKDSAGRTHRYHVLRCTEQIQADHAGDIAIGPVFVKINYPVQVRRSFFDYRVTRHRKETARAEAVVVRVKSPPESQRPDDFEGAIGKFVINVQAKPIHVVQGEPVTLTISIGGRPVESVAAPNIATHAELASRFDYTKDELIGDIEARRKVFRRAIFPKQAGEQTIPPITWSYFDPKKESYVSLASKPIHIVVDARAQDAASIKLNGIDPNSHKGSSLTILTGGILPNYDDVDTVLANQTFAMTTPWYAALIAPPFLWMCSTLIARHRDRLRADAGFARRRRAKRTALKLLTEALNQNAKQEQWDALGAVMTEYLSERFNLPPGELTPIDVANLLDQCKLETSTISDVVNFLDTCTAARYAPSKLDSLSARESARKIRSWINRIERSG